MLVDQVPSASEIAGLLGVQTAQIYELRKSGVLPDQNATLRLNVTAYIGYLKNKAAGRNSELAQQVQMQKIKLDEARTAQTWLDIYRKRESLVDEEGLMDILEPLLLNLRDSLQHIASEYPIAKDAIFTVMHSMADIGIKLKADAESEAASYVGN